MSGCTESRVQVPWVYAGVVALLGLHLGACNRGGGEPGAPPSASGCPQLEPEDTVALDAEVRVLASGQFLGRGSGEVAPSLITDGGDVYWFDSNGSIFVVREDEPGVVELMRTDQRGPSQRHRQEVVGIAAGPDRLYAGDAFWLSGSDGIPLYEIEPPGRLLSISKQDGSTEVLLELRDLVVVPIAADSERVIVFSAGGELAFYQVRLSDPQLERLPLAAPVPSSRLFGDKLYWLTEGRPPRLLRSGFDDVEPEVVMQMDTDDAFFSIGPDYILSREERILPGYYYVGKDFVLYDDAGCRALPGERMNTLLGTALDPQYAYWLGRRRVDDVGTLTPEDYKLVRVDVQSGVSTRLNMPGFTAQPYVQLVGHDDTRIFLSSGDTLVAVQKP